MESSSSPSWVILGQVARVADDDADLPLGTIDFSIHPVVAPPRVTILTIPPRMFPDTVNLNHYPCVVAVDPFGLILLRTNQTLIRGPAVIDTPGRREFCWKPYVMGYFILDASEPDKPALRLPNPECIMHSGHLGFIAAPGGGGHYMIVELQPFFSTNRAILLSFSSQVGAWVKREVFYPVPDRQLAPNGVVSHSGRLWWVDLSCCLLTCDPFADAPVLRLVPLPPGKEVPQKHWAVLDKYRCVGVSGGKLRFVDMYMKPSIRGLAQISVWTLPDLESTEWTLEYETTFMEIFADESYKATGLPKNIPVVLALIHPTNPNVVYIFLRDHLIGIDVPARKVVECEVYDLVGPPRGYLATRFVHAWQLPQAACSASAQETGNGVKEELQQLHL